MYKFYNELAKWWHLISDPADYAEEAAFFLPLMADVTGGGHATLLEPGSGGGNTASHLKAAFASVTLVDLSAAMLETSRLLNPECEHLVGDMRTMRLDRTFDVVFIHDAIDYMLTEDDLRQALTTAFIHTRPGGLAMFVPDHVRETFEPDSDHGGEDAADAHAGVRFLEWSHPPGDDETFYTVDYVFLIREAGQPPQVIHEQHTVGLFPLATWLHLLAEVGFQAEYHIDSFERHVFVGRKPA